MFIYNCRANGSCYRTAQFFSNGSTQPLSDISASVGLNGVNREEDVRIIQQRLNGVPEESGGPRPVLDEDGRCGKYTRDAIRDFQLKQFPSSKPDIRIDPGKRTIRRLNELTTRRRTSVDGVSRQQFLLIVNAYVPEVVRRVRIARQRLQNARAAYSGKLIKPTHQDQKLVDWHFKTHKTDDPVGAIGLILAIYDRMDQRLTWHITRARPLFQLGFAKSSDQAVMYTSIGGWDALEDELDGSGEAVNKIKVVATHAGPSTIIHELAHLCGGKSPADAIGHMANPVPLPNGTRLEEGFSNYRTMNAQEARRNAASYQSLTEPEPSQLGPPMGDEW